MKIFVLHEKFGGAVVVAESREEAFGILRENDGDEEYLTFNKTAANLEEVSLDGLSKIVYYYAS